jgi:hypothetical protein
LFSTSDNNSTEGTNNLLPSGRNKLVAATKALFL